MKEIIQTDQAPAAIGTYSQAVKVDNTVYISGQIPLDPVSGEMVQGEFAVHVRQMFTNLLAVAAAAGGSAQHIVKLNIYVLDLQHFATINEVMAEFFAQPYPARAAVEVSALPKGAVVEADAVAVLNT